MRALPLGAPLLAALIASPALAHGGQYRGPTSVVPPPATGGAAVNGGPAGAPGGPTAPGPATPGAAPAAPATLPAAPGGVPLGRQASRGVPLDDDLTRWDIWWEFRKDPFLRLRESMRSPRALLPADGLVAPGGAGSRDIEPPTASDVMLRVAPALERALGGAPDRDTITGCMVALAKIGRDLPNAPLLRLFAERLPSHDQEVRETAALCLGIAGQDTPEAIDLLADLAHDTERGRNACARADVDERTRAFATYALGLLAQRTSQPAHRHRIVHDLLALVAPTAHAGRNLTVAAIGALSQLPDDGSAARATLADAVVSALWDYYQRDLGPGEQLVQAHCPAAIAHLLGPNAAASARFRERFAADLRASLADAGDTPRALLRTNHHLAQSCAMALGELGRPWEDGASPDAALGELLLRCWREHKDHQTRYFAVIAVGRLGGAAARAALLRELDRAGRSIEKPWVALSLGLLVGRRLQEARVAGRSLDPDPDPVVGKALLGVLDDVKNPSTVGAVGIALGLCQHRPAADVLRRLLQENSSRDDVAGQLAIGLALLEEHRARGDLHALLQRSVRRPQLLLQVATALGRLGDASVIDDLTGLLSDGDNSLARLSAIASALGQIGDRRSVEPLLAMLGDPRVTALTRAFAAVALGGICDKDPLPWNAGFAAALNYRAAVETLTDGAAGILDIL